MDKKACEAKKKHKRSLKNRYKPIVREVAIILFTISHEDHNCTGIATGKQSARETKSHNQSAGQFIHRCLDMDEMQKHTQNKKCHSHVNVMLLRLIITITNFNIVDN